MAVTDGQLREAIRVGDSTEEQTQVARLRIYATTAVMRYAPEAPQEALDEAVIRLAGYLFDQPTITRSGNFANALRNSGAAGILTRYRIKRAGSTGEAIAVAADGAAPGNPVVGHPSRG